MVETNCKKYWWSSVDEDFCIFSAKRVVRNKVVLNMKFLALNHMKFTEKDKVDNTLFTLLFILGKCLMDS